MTDARARIEDAKRRNEIAELNALMDEVEAEYPDTPTAPAPEPIEEPDPEPDAKTIANNLIVNGRTGGHPPQIKRAARYIDATLR
ncbi:hypothetical protein [Leucobacter sp.]